MLRNIRSVGVSAFALAMALVAAGCGGPTALPPSGPHPATDPKTVVIHQAPTGKYEVLGVVETPITGTWGADAAIDPVVDALKAKAAAMGANGLLLRVEGAKIEGTGLYQGKPHTVVIDKVPASKAMATAIFIVP